MTPLAKVPGDLCIGCGVCAAICPAQSLEMTFNVHGEWVPADRGLCRAGCHLCVDACPFSSQAEDEDTIARTLYGQTAEIRHRPETGYYLGLHAGHSPAFRSASSSGGLGRWLLGQFLTEGLADAVLCVRDTNDAAKCFEYAVFDSAAGVYKCSRSAYYPVEMSDVLRHVLQHEGRYTVVGVPCFIKALRLAMRQNRWLRERVVITVGLVCGQGKSKFFHEFLLRSLGVNPAQRQRSGFRFKDTNRLASDHLFRVCDGRKLREINFLGTAYGQAYNSGQFKPDACNYCDDVFAETADAVLMDAWLPRFVEQPQGTSIVLTRTRQLEDLIARANASGELELAPIGIDDVIETQAAGLYSKRAQLAYRIWLASRDGITVPAKRVAPARPSAIERRLRRACAQLRGRSFEAMLKQQAAGDGLDTYNEALGPALRSYLLWLRLSRGVDTYLTAFKRRWRLFLTTGSFGPLPFRRRGAERRS